MNISTCNLITIILSARLLISSSKVKSYLYKESIRGTKAATFRKILTIPVPSLDPGPCPGLERFKPGLKKSIGSCLTWLRMHQVCPCLHKFGSCLHQFGSCLHKFGSCSPARVILFRAYMHCAGCMRYISCSTPVGSKACTVPGTPVLQPNGEPLFRGKRILFGFPSTLLLHCPTVEYEVVSWRYQLLRSKPTSPLMLLVM